VEAFDTNVVVRLLVREDEEQYQRAERVLRRVTAGPGAWLSSVVLAEVAWVLRGAYKFDRATIAAALHRLIAIDGVHVEDGATTRLALTVSRPAPRISLTISSWSQHGGAAPSPFTPSTIA
jgi:predicted nucleic-acid-binding protein